MSRGAMRIFAPPTLQQKDAIVSRRVVVNDQREFRKSALDSKLLPAFVPIERLTTVGTKSPLKKPGREGDARCFPEIKFEQIFCMIQPSGKVSIMPWMKTELLLFIFPVISAQSSELPAVMDSNMLTEFAYQPGPSYLSLILLALTVGLSGSVYLCVLRYICTGCCQPVVVGPEDESMSGVV